VPVVVTTAELWRINPGVTIEDIRSAGAVEDIAQQKDALILHARPDNELSKHTKRKLLRSFDSDEMQKIGVRLLANRWADSLSGDRDFYLSEEAAGEFEGFVNVFAANYPCLFLIVHYSKFRETVVRLLSLFETPTRVTTRTSGNPDVGNQGEIPF